MNDYKPEYEDLLLINLIKMLEISTKTSLGIIDDPVNNKNKKIDLDIAKLNIDMIMMLKNKVKNNVPAEIEKFLKDILAALQMKFLEISNTLEENGSKKD